MRNTADSRRDRALLAGAALLALILLASSLQGTARGQGPVTAEPSLTAIPMPLATITYAPNIEIITGGIGKYGSRICLGGAVLPGAELAVPGSATSATRESVTRRVYFGGGDGDANSGRRCRMASLYHKRIAGRVMTPNEASDVLPPCTDLIDPSFYRDHYAPDWRPVFVVERDMGDYIHHSHLPL